MRPWAPVAERQRVLPPVYGERMPDPASDALLKRFLDLLKEITELHRALSELGAQSEQGEAQTSLDPVVISQPE